MALVGDNSIKSKRTKPLLLVLTILAVSIVVTACSSRGSIPIDNDDIAGTVSSDQGAEVGVWVIAETTDLPTTYTKTVVTNEQGRYLIPDLPDASYKVWVRGYGLVDSAPVVSRPGRHLDLQAVVAENEKAAAHYYPAQYWYSMLKPPAASEFPGTGPEGNGIAPDLVNQQYWMTVMKESCLICHQLGNQATRELVDREQYSSGAAAWQHRLMTSIDSPGAAVMLPVATLFGHDKDGVNSGFKMFGDWTDRIAAGETPAQKPRRPIGVERSMVLTQWDWAIDADGNPQFVHDEIATDKRDPTVNANGRVFGAAQIAGKAVWLDPNTHEMGEAVLPSNATRAYFGGASYQPEGSYAQPHNPMLDQDGKLWLTTYNRNKDQVPGWCTDGSINEYARMFPLAEVIGRASQVSVFDPETGETQFVDTCFGTHHLQFGFDDDNTLYLSGDSKVMGWVNTKVFHETGSAEQATGWCPNIIDTNGDGKMGEPNDPSGPADPSKDTLIYGFLYGLGPNPVDDTMWYAHFIKGGTPYHIPGGILRMDRGSNPPSTCQVEYYQPPVDENGIASAFNPRALDMDTNGIAWVAFGSGHIGRFDRGQCKVFKGPTVTGQQCKEGWTLYKIPAPEMEGVDYDVNASWNYLMWVDQHNILGLGKNVPIVPGTQSDSLIAFIPEQEKFIEVRVPYPMGSFFRGLDGRIDDPDGGWKGRGLWTNYASHPNSHMEGANGEDRPSKLVKVQMRPNPLAK